MSKHIKVVKRDPGEGLGIQQEKVAEVEVSEEWWQNSFNSALSKLSKPKKNKKRKVDESALNEPSLEDLFRATGGKRMGMRARIDQLGKIHRTEGSSPLS